jgi:hypothetical protein
VFDAEAGVEAYEVQQVATSVATMLVRSLRVRPFSVTLFPPEPSVSFKLTRETSHAGKAPNNAAVMPDAVIAKTSVPASTLTSFRRGMSAGPKRTNQRTPKYASSMPKNPPANTRSKFSTSIY